MAKTILSGLLLIALIFGTGQALSAEESLKFRLVTSIVDITSFGAPFSDDNNVSAAKSVGVAIFEDGRIAFKDYVVTINGRGAEGDWSGYSTYTFENGDKLNLSFTGGWGADGAGGDYVIQSGTGAFEGATGTGRFDAVDEPWDNGSLFDGSFTIQSAGN